MTETTQLTGRRSTKWLPWIARVLALLWGGWWTFFGIASAFAEDLDLIGILIHTSVPGLIFLASAALAWRWEAIGGVILLIEAAIVCVGYPVLVAGRFPLSTITFVLLTMGLPPLAAGVLFLLHWRRREAITNLSESETS